MTKTANQLWEEISKGGGATDTLPMTQDDLDQESNRNLKKSYAYWFISILIGQLLVMNAVFIGQGLGCLKFDEVTLRIYTTSTILEVFGVIVIIVHNLFPSSKNNRTT